MIDIRSTLYKLETSYPGNSEECRPYIYHSEFPGYEVSSLKNVDLISIIQSSPDMKSLVCRTGGTLNDRYKVYILQTRDFIPGEL
jgi:hypothetical protein